MIGYTSDEARELARNLYQSDEIVIDEEAEVDHITEPSIDEGGAWVRAWVWVPPKEISLKLESQ